MLQQQQQQYHQHHDFDQQQQQVLQSLEEQPYEQSPESERGYQQVRNQNNPLFRAADLFSRAGVGGLARRLGEFRPVVERMFKRVVGGGGGEE